MNKKFETLKAGLGNGLIVSYKEWPHLKKLNLKGRLTMVSDAEIGTTYKRKRNGCYGDDIPWSGNHNDVETLEVKPHLFPLSHLNKPIRVEGYNDGEEFVPMYELLRIKIERMKLSKPTINITEPYLVKSFWIETKISHKYGRDSVSVILIDGFDRWEYWIIELLHKWHFNVFSLPESDYIDASVSKVYEPKLKN